MTRGSSAGFALPLALLAMTVLSTLISAVLMLAVFERRIGQNRLRLEQAFLAAEAGADLTIASWSTTDTSLTVGGERQFSGSLGPGAGWYQGAVRRINRRLLLIRSEGLSADSGARQHVGVLVRIVSSGATWSLEPLPERSWLNLP
jgi:hypothetical protein